MSNIMDIKRNDYSSFISLFIEITNNCNLNCHECYTKYKNYQNKKAISLSDIINAIDTVVPSKVIYTGGEPLLYPELISHSINFYNAHYKQHWNTVVCSNLIFDKLSEEQQIALINIDYLQTSYSVDRFKTKSMFYKWKNNFKHAKELLKASQSSYRNKFVDINVTINPLQLKEKPETLISKLLELEPDGIGLEFLSFHDPNKIDKEFYNRSDAYMKRVFELLDPKINLSFQAMKNNLNNGYTMHCNNCKNRMNYLVNPDGEIILGCLCNPLLTNKEKIDTTKKLIEQCIDCKYFKYCRGNCERFGLNCGFPKQTFEYVFNKINGDDYKCQTTHSQGK